MGRASWYCLVRRSPEDSHMTIKSQIQEGFLEAPRFMSPCDKVRPKHRATTTGSGKNMMTVT